ncbi:MAG: CoA transferase, partial [Trebonia sp.]
IFHRTRTGAGGLVTASLAQTATYHQAIFMLATQAGGSMLSRAALRRSAPGRSSGTTKARDGWIFLGMKPSQLPSLRSVPWLAAAAGLSPADATAVAEALSAALAERSTAEATDALQQAGVGAHEVLTTEQVMTSEPARSLASA